MIYEFEGFRPVVHESAFVHPTASVIGNVMIGRDVYVGPGAAFRGDWGGIEIEDGCNVQESCVIHMFPGVTVVLEASAHVGHGAVIHGARIGRNALIGMNAVIMDNAVDRRGVHRRRADVRAGGHADPGAKGRGRQSGEDREGRERRDDRLEDGRDAALSGPSESGCTTR